jgi:hypothetical protein
VVTQLAVPSVFSRTAAHSVRPLAASVKVTVPVGVPAPGGTTRTVAVNVATAAGRAGGAVALGALVAAGVAAERDWVVEVATGVGVPVVVALAGLLRLVAAALGMALALLVAVGVELGACGGPELVGLGGAAVAAPSRAAVAGGVRLGVGVGESDAALTTGLARPNAAAVTARASPP